MVRKGLLLPAVLVISSPTAFAVVMSQLVAFALGGLLAKLKVLPRFELGSLDSESRVLTITPQNQVSTLGSL